MSSSLLGRVVRRHAGEAVFRAVEELRVACRDRRVGAVVAMSLDEVLARVDALPLEITAPVARAFMLSFVLSNTAEHVQLIWWFRDADDSSETPWTIAGVLRETKATGVEADALRSVLDRIEVRPVLTAHPTESTRRTILDLQGRVADLLLRRDEVREEERAALEERLDTEVKLLWLTTDVRADRPSVLDEVPTARWSLEDRLLPVLPRVHETLARACREVYGVDIGGRALFRLGSWVGGDRDGNPLVTPDTTRSAVRRMAHAVLSHHLGRVKEWVRCLSLSSRIARMSPTLRDSIEADREAMPDVYASNRRRDADDPVRMKLSFIAARLEATQSLLSARDAGRPAHEPAAYPDSAAFLADLGVVREALETAGARKAMVVILAPLITFAKTVGFAGYHLDVREDAAAFAEAVSEVARSVGLGEMDGEALRTNILTRGPILSPFVRYTERTERTIEMLRAVRDPAQEVALEAVETCGVSMCRSPDDVLRVLLLGGEVGLLDLSRQPPRSRLDVVPLFETLRDLEAAPAILREIFDDPAQVTRVA